jgi:hypothetical protein
LQKEPEMQAISPTIVFAGLLSAVLGYSMPDIRHALAVPVQAEDASLQFKGVCKQLHPVEPLP